MKIVNEALKSGRRMLTEYESKRLLESYGIPVVREKLVGDNQGVLEAARRIGYPVVLKFCSSELTHKTERRLLELDIRNEQELRHAFGALKNRGDGLPGDYLVQEMVKGSRELMIGLIRDPQFGPCVMFGLGGVFTEVLKDVSFRVAPITRDDAFEMMKEPKAHRILEGIRGMEAVDLHALSSCLLGMARLGLEQEAVAEVDVNPLVIRGNAPVAVDALVALKPRADRKSRLDA